MARVTVEPEALARWSGDAGRTRARLALSLHEIDATVAALAAGWDGAAAERGDRHVQAWRAAAGRLLDTLGELAAIADGARSNYTAVTVAGRRTWSSPAAMAPGVLGGAQPAHRIDADTDDIQAAVFTLTATGETLVEAWMGLSQALAGTAGMAGDDGLAPAFGRDHDGMATAAWQGWRATAILVTAITGGLAETGTSMLAAEHRSNPAATGSPPTIAARPVPVPAPVPPPAAAGRSGSGAAGPLAAYWPAADPELLRRAAAAWRAAAPAVTGGAAAASSAMSALMAANPDPTLGLAREFTDRALARDPSTGLCGLLDQHCRQVALACHELADATERTRHAIRDAVAGAMAADEWYHPVAAVLDAVLTRGAADAAAHGADLILLTSALDAIRVEHERAVRRVLALIPPAAADRLSRVATSLVPPDPVAAPSCAVTAPAGVSEAERQHLVAATEGAGHKIDPAQTLQVVRAPDGRIVWLERGDGRSGLAHLLRADRIAQFAGRGVAPEEVATIAVRAITEGTRLGPVRDGGVAYEVPLGDRRVDVVVVEGANGYLVTAYPLSSRSTIRSEAPAPGG